MTIMTRMNRPTILLIGCTGQVGWELRRTLATLGDLISASLKGSHGPAVDFADPNSLHRLFKTSNPDLVVNAAAFTAVDQAEKDVDTARLVNADAPTLIGALAAELNIPVVHYSTDYVFSGDADRPYREDDPASPLGVYGKTKLAGELGLLNSGAEVLILRTSWVYGSRGHNFFLTMRRLFREKEELKVVNDQIGAPTWSRMIAEATAQILAQSFANGFRFGQRGGLYHLTAAGQTSWYGFAEAIGKLLQTNCRLHPIPTSEYPTPARRPLFSLLDNKRLLDTFSVCLPDWQESLMLCVEEMANNQRLS